MPRRPTEKHSALQYIQDVVLRHEGDNCLIWPYRKSKADYALLSIDSYGSKIASRLICEWAHGKPPEGKTDAAHSCGNRSCVSPSHLRWATRQENMDDIRRYRPKEPILRRVCAHLRDDQIRWLADQAKQHGVTSAAVLRQIIEEVRD